MMTRKRLILTGIFLLCAIISVMNAHRIFFYLALFMYEEDVPVALRSNSEFHAEYKFMKVNDEYTFVRLNSTNKSYESFSVRKASNKNVSTITKMEKLNLINSYYTDTGCHHLTSKQPTYFISGSCRNQNQHQSFRRFVKSYTASEI